MSFEIYPSITAAYKAGFTSIRGPLFTKPKPRVVPVIPEGTPYFLARRNSESFTRVIRIIESRPKAASPIIRVEPGAGNFYEKINRVEHWLRGADQFRGFRRKRMLSPAQPVQVAFVSVISHYGRESGLPMMQIMRWNETKQEWVVWFAPTPGV